MAKTTSLSFPKMFNVSQNSVAVLEDNAAIVNRTRLMILTEPTELYHNPDFGVGLKRHLWKYNTDNEKAIIQDRIIEQLRLHEPYVVPDDTQYVDGLLYTGTTGTTAQVNEANSLKMTVALTTTYSDVIEVEIENTSSTSSSDS